MAASSASDQATAPVPLTLGATRRSTSSTGGKGRAPIRTGSRTQPEPPLREHHGLERRRGAAEHEARALDPRADGGDVAGVIARRLAVLVAGLVLLVEHDHAEVRAPARTRPIARPRRRGARRGAAAARRRPARRRRARCAAPPPGRRTRRGTGSPSAASVRSPAPGRWRPGPPPAPDAPPRDRPASSRCPVTPNSTAPSPRSRAPATAASAACWSAVRDVGGGTAGKPANGSRTRSACADAARSPRRSSARSTAGVKPSWPIDVADQRAAAELARAPRTAGAAWARAGRVRRARAASADRRPAPPPAR